MLTRRTFLRSLDSGLLVAAAPALVPERRFWQVSRNAPIGMQVEIDEPWPTDGAWQIEYVPVYAPDGSDTMPRLLFSRSHPRGASFSNLPSEQPITRESLERAIAYHREVFDHPPYLDPQRPALMSPATYRRFQDDGLIDEHGMLTPLALGDDA